MVTLLGMPDRELLDMLKIMCEEAGDQQADISLTPKQNSHSSEANKAQ